MARVRVFFATGVQVYLAHHIALRGEWQDFQIPNNRTQLYGGSLLSVSNGPLPPV